MALAIDLLDLSAAAYDQVPRHRVALALDAAETRGAERGRREEREGGNWPAIRAILRDVRTALSTAAEAARIEAFPGPGWRRRTADLLRLLDQVDKRDKRGEHVAAGRTK